VQHKYFYENKEQIDQKISCNRCNSATLSELPEERPLPLMAKYHEVLWENVSKNNEMNELETYLSESLEPRIITQSSDWILNWWRVRI